MANKPVLRAGGKMLTVWPPDKTHLGFSDEGREGGGGVGIGIGGRDLTRLLETVVVQF